MRWPGLDSRLIPYADAAIADARQAGLHPRVTSVRRNWAEQTRLWQNYRAGLSLLPANPPGESSHQYGVGWDSVVLEGEWDDWNDIRARWGWKLYPNDPVHAEFPGWQSYRTMLRLT